VDAEQYLKEEGTEGLDPDLTPPEIIGDINVSPALRRYKDEILEAANVRVHLAQAAQVRVAQASQRLDKYHMDEIGGLKARIHKAKFVELQLRYGARWFRDPATFHEVLRRHPEIRVRCGLRKFSLRVNGFRKEQKQMSAIRGGRGHGAQLPLNRGSVTGDPATPMAPIREDGGRSGHATAGSPRIPDVRKVILATR
jgi:hypothetical protein